MSWAIKQNLNYLNVLEHQRKIPHDSVMWGQIQTQCIGFYYITRLHRISNGNGTSNSSRSKVTFGQLELEVPFWDSILFHSTLKSTLLKGLKVTFMDLVPDNTPFSCVYGSSDWLYIPTSRRAHRLLHNWRWWDARSLSLSWWWLVWSSSTCVPIINLKVCL